MSGMHVRALRILAPALPIAMWLLAPSDKKGRAIAGGGSATLTQRIPAERSVVNTLDRRASGSSTGRRVSSWSRALSSNAALVGGLWFVGSLVLLVWVWSGSPVSFSSPDEAVNRLAATLVSETGRPLLPVPHDDVEDLVHPRLWMTVGDHAIPAYWPAGYYIYALALSVPGLGPLLVLALAASGIAAFAGGAIRLLPNRKFLGALAPAMAFPALYWLLRPWMNTSLLLTFVGWAFFAWVCWRRSNRTAWFACACLSLAAAASVRPDYAPYLFLTAIPLALGERPEKWRHILVCAFAAIILAVAINLVLNGMTTGNPFHSAYETYASRRDADSVSDGSFTRLSTLFFPWGLPSITSAMTFFDHYCVRMGPIGLLLAGQVTLVPLLASVPWRRRAFYLIALAVIAIFLVSRMTDGLYGARESEGLLRHSIPRYWSPVYLLAALPPLLYAARTKHEIVVGGIICGCMLLSVLGAREVYTLQPESMTYLHELQARSETRIAQLSGEIPDDAILYTMTEDKALWSRWRIGIVSDPDRTAASIDRSLRAGYSVYVVQGRMPAQVKAELESALSKRSLWLTTEDERLGIYRAGRAASASVADVDRDSDD
ncbi:MAG TPA: hypothetical protein VFH62_06680 [Dehalococcoidia bacterium]|jgi:hypothetical protein|nr:hypothetical protein [Dehalococcoidia bacterium]